MCLSVHFVVLAKISRDGKFYACLENDEIFKTKSVLGLETSVFSDAKHFQNITCDVFEVVLVIGLHWFEIWVLDYLVGKANGQSLGKVFRVIVVCICC